MYDRSYFYSCENLFYELLNPIFMSIRDNIYGLFQDRISDLDSGNFVNREEYIYLLRQTIREYQESQIKLKLIEIDAQWDLHHWQGILSRKETENLLGKKDTLLILFSPPELSPDVPPSIQNNLPIEFKSIKDKLKLFYSEKDYNYGVKFYTDYFKKPVGDIYLEQLYSILSPVPTAVFYTDITDYNCRFSLGFWNDKSYEPTIISSPLWNWEKTFNKFLKIGLDEKQSFRAIRELIIIYNQLLASYFIDTFYVSIDPYYPLKFPIFTTHLAKELIRNKECVECYFLQLKQMQEEELIILEEIAQKKEQNLKGNVNQWKVLNTIKVRGDYPIYSIAIHPNDDIIASACGYDGIQEFDIYSGELLNITMSNHHSVIAVAYDCSGESLICGGGKQTIYVHGKAKYKLVGHTNAVKALAVSCRDNILIASASYDSTVRLWDLTNKKLAKVFKRHTKGVYGLAFSPDGTMLATGGGDYTAKLWSLTDYKVIHDFKGHFNSVLSVAFSPDGKILATGSMDKMIRLWNTETGELINTLMGHSFWIESLAFNPQGMILVSSSNDKTIKFWNYISGECIRTITQKDSWISAIAFNRDGSLLVTGSNNGIIKVWQNH
ncbi:hypothetical protein CSQ80_14630 [Cyanobacterium aponinum IPPAS B-1201]|uniref:WD40 repeat-containing protein n=2 Tax=Cyanobacterium TaxID=102234 RepID=A0A844GYY6_9CHRO|nr:hypothetical protein [Cyanobacterium aponinum 0216]PHV61617.1 hypothetical protein CSQ80_14630 [Cyanobacterium aponinum IPPAS B-1201]